MRKQMHKEVSYNEKVRHEKLIQEAFIDEINKDGAPFLNEISELLDAGKLKCTRGEEDDSQ